ncbi:spore coat protein [Brevibacillus fluminis]|uniref:Spore coat protein n=1 Tax=Brevibacillus fluminis TaxID=511487 RepID=A0A3M8DCP6_9BACL|nr:spore coat protein [Brevibacillus fluminis]RNB85910.1 spore coat protein [Brevibacillus fluminis]
MINQLLNPNGQQQQQQNQNIIQNPKPPGEPQVKGPEMNDRDFINDGLSTCKYLAEGLNIAAWESSHQQLHADYLQMLNETQQCARELYNTMFQKGWYKLEAVEQQKLQQAYQQFNGYSSQFPYRG